MTNGVADGCRWFPTLEQINSLPKRQGTGALHNLRTSNTPLDAIASRRAPSLRFFHRTFKPFGIHNVEALCLLVMLTKET